MSNTINAIIALLLLVAGGFLQIFLSKNKNKWLGLILPTIALLFSFLMVLNIMVMDSMTSWDVFVILGSTFLISNIPTIVLVGIYFACREKMKVRNQVEKMNIQDLK